MRYFLSALHESMVNQIIHVCSYFVLHLLANKKRNTHTKNSLVCYLLNVHEQFTLHYLD